jgi:ABC-type nitrate/sulfonate/bicarbonate transport system substrate-binding protein
MDKIKIGIGVSSIGRFLPVLGKSAGLFERQDIAVEVVNQQDEEKVVEDIVTHEAPVGTPNAPSLVFSLLQGNDLLIIGAILNRPAFFLAAHESIHSITDLMGKKVGINRPRRMAGIVMLALLRRWGRSGEDVTLIDLGLNDRSSEALRTGQIDAALLPPEKAFVAQEEGFRLIADSLGLECHWVPLVTTRHFLSDNRDLVERIVAVYRQSIRLFRAERQMTLDEIARWLPTLASKPQVAEKCYDLFAPRFEETLMPSVISLNGILHEVALQDPRAGSLISESLIATTL